MRERLKDKGKRKKASKSRGLGLGITMLDAGSCNIANVFHCNILSKI